MNIHNHPTYHDDVSAGRLESDRLREWCVVFNDNVTGEAHEVRVRARNERDAYDAAFMELAHRTFTLNSITD